MGKEYLKTERGSITLFVLISCLFFLMIITASYMFLLNKEKALDEQIRKVQKSYEVSQDEIYAKLVKEISITLTKYFAKKKSHDLAPF